MLSKEQTTIIFLKMIDERPEKEIISFLKENSKLIDVSYNDYSIYRKAYDNGYDQLANYIENMGGNPNVKWTN